MTRKPWKMSFRGAVADNLALWAADHTPSDVESVCVPFMGSCKTAALMTQEGRTIEAWDMQHIVKEVVDSVFMAEEPKRNVLSPKATKGYTYHNRFISDMPADAAGLVDYVAEYGTGYEHVAMMSMLVRSTYRGRMDTWSRSSDASTLWKGFERRCERQAEWVNLPGEIIQTVDNFYDDMPEKEYDLLYVDPPKVTSGGTDVYWKNFGMLNEALTGQEPMIIDKWTYYDYRGKIRKVLEVPSRLLMFVYTSDVRPSLDEMKELLADYGKLVEQNHFKHGSRFDYCLLYERNGKTSYGG